MSPIELLTNNLRSTTKWFLNESIQIRRHIPQANDNRFLSNKSATLSTLEQRHEKYHSKMGRTNLKKSIPVHYGQFSLVG